MKRSTGPGTKGEASRSAASVRDARLPGLDGLRAVAVVAVILFHLNLPGVLPAGFLGVDIFFTLSGFIITALLLREHARNGRVDWLAFCGRRARRLLPPTLAMIALAVPLTALVAPEALQRLRADLPAALLYVSNWWQIHSQQSYFEALGTGRPCCGTCGRWPSKSSSTCCGRWSWLRCCIGAAAPRWPRAACWRRWPAAAGWPGCTRAWPKAATRAACTWARTRM
ncbi:MAG: acyltransferase [Rubrivivax sp.]